MGWNPIDHVKDAASAVKDKVADFVGWDEIKDWDIADKLGIKVKRPEFVETDFDLSMGGYDPLDDLQAIAEGRAAPSAAEQQMLAGTQQLQQQVGAGAQGVIGGPQDLATQLAAHQAFNVGQQGKAAQALLQAQQRMVAEQQFAQTQLAQLEMENAQVAAQAEAERLYQAAREAQRAAWVADAAGLTATAAAAYFTGGNPMAMSMANQGGRQVAQGLYRG